MTTTQRYPSSLSQGQGGPSRRPSRHQLVYPSPSIDDEVPPAPSPLPASLPFGDITRKSLNNLNSSGVASKPGSGSDGPVKPALKPTIGVGAETGGAASTKQAGGTGRGTGAGKGLNPNSKPYMPKYQRSAPDLHHVAAAHAAQGAYGPGDGTGSTPMMPSFGYTATPHAHHQYAAHMPFGNGTGSGQMYPDGTFVYPSIAPIAYTLFDSRQESLIEQHPTAGALSSGRSHTDKASKHANTGTHPSRDLPANETPVRRQEYSSLQHLLEQAGYAETRVHTPPAERIRQLRQQRSFVNPSSRAGTGSALGGRRIMKTFDEVDVDEVRDLYSAFGMGFNAGPGADTNDLGASSPTARRAGSGTIGVQSDMGYETDSPSKVVCHITTPAIPLKSSSSVLRDVAMQDLAQQQAISPPSNSASASGASSYSTRFGFDNNAYASFAAGPDMYNSQNQQEQQQQQYWWNGFGASVLSRAAQTVRDLSPTKEYTGFDFSFASAAATASSEGKASSVASANGTIGLGLGLARGGQGVKKAKPAFTLNRFGLGGYETAVDANEGRDEGERDGGLLSEAPPAFSMPAPSTSTDTPTPANMAQRRGALTNIALPPFSQAAGQSGSSAQQDEENELWSPLPADYETQCEDDELFSTSFDVGSEQSFGSSEEGRSPDQAYFVLPTREAPGLAGATGQVQAEKGDDEAALLGKEEGDGGGMATLASRIMRDAVELDDCDDSPIQSTVALPTIEVDEAPSTPSRLITGTMYGAETTQQQRPPAIRASTSPSPTRALSDAPSTLGLTTTTDLITPAGNAESTQTKKPLKYGDRATKLRMARSTPVLARVNTSPAAMPAVPKTPANAGWFASIRSYLPTAYSTKAPTSVSDVETCISAAVHTSTPYTPFRVTPAIPAAPIAKSAAVLCDSTSDMAEDLPAIPMGMAMAMAAHAQDRAELQGTAASAAAALARKISMGKVSQEQAKGKGATSQDQNQTFALRLRPSLAKMRSMVFGPPVSSDVPAVPAIPSAYNSATTRLVAEGEGNTPMLSPRIDLAEGEAFAGWSPVKVQRGPRVGPGGEVYTPKKAVWAHHATASASKSESEATEGMKGEGATPEGDGQEVEDGYGSTIIDYTQSFFYKPCTPPAHVARLSGAQGKVANGDSAAEQARDDQREAAQAGSSSRASSTGGQVAKRQRSIKSLRKALLIPVAPSAPPVPALPAGIASQRDAKAATVSGPATSTRHARSSASATFASIFSSAPASSSSSVDSSAPTIPQLRTPPTMPLDTPSGRMPEPPTLAILSPGAWEAGLPPKALVLEDEDWETRQGQGQDGDEAFGMAGKKGRKGKGKGGKVRRKASTKSVRAE